MTEPKKRTRTITVEIEVCKRCGREMADHFSASKLGVTHRSGYVMYEHEYCSDCTYLVLDEQKNQRLKFIIGAKITDLEIEQGSLKGIIMTKGGRKWVIHPDGYVLSVSEILKEKKT